MDWAVGKKEYQGENVKQEQVEVKEEEVELDEAEAEVKQEAEEEVEPKEEPESEDDDSEDDDDEDENEDENVDERGDNTSQTRDGKWHSLKNGHDLGENLTVFVRNLVCKSKLHRNISFRAFTLVICQHHLSSSVQHGGGQNFVWRFQRWCDATLTSCKTC